jgi:hypothetical protein
MEQIVELVKDFGFPAVAFVLMWFMANNTIHKNTQAINRLSDSINRAYIQDLTHNTK